MGTHDRHIAAPIFVVGSPRSGTSILTWCLGQHPNILPTEESDWLGPFAVQAAAHHALGITRGERSQLSALGIARAEFLEQLGNAIDAMVLGHRRRLEELNHAVAERDPRQACPEFAVARSDAEPKARWADGTPEYSLYIYGLLGLFPAAKFIHILRDADEVAASMLAFRHEDGSPLVANADEAYAYWQRTVEACVRAEQAFGPERIFRLRHADLVAEPERSIGRLMQFLGEPCVNECMAPLARRINSSFGGDAAAPRRLDVHSPIARQAREFSTHLLAEPAATSPSDRALAELAADFEKRVARARDLDANYTATQRVIESLQLDLNGNWVENKNRELAQAREFAAEKTRQAAAARQALLVCGIVFVMQAAGAAIMYSLLPGTAAGALWLACAGAGILIYAWLRRAGLRQLVLRKPAAVAPRPDSNEAIS